MTIAQLARILELPGPVSGFASLAISETRSALEEGGGPRGEGPGGEAGENSSCWVADRHGRASHQI